MNNLEQTNVKNCYYFDDIINLIFENILLDEKSNENILVFDMSYKTFIGAKPLQNHLCSFMFKTIYDLLEFLIEIDIQYYVAPKNMMPFTIGSDIC